MAETVAQHLTVHLRAAGQNYVHGDQSLPCAVLWPDPERLWARVLRDIQGNLPELYSLGDYNPKKHRSLALWLRDIEERIVSGSPAPGMVPVFYLPGISRDDLQGVEDCPKALAPLRELQSRGILWLNPNGREWSPKDFLVSHHGLGLQVSSDRKTEEALQRALPRLLDECVVDLRRRSLDVGFFNDFASPDAAGRILRWLNDPEGSGHSKDDVEWDAFRQQCRADYYFDPERDGAIWGAQLLAERRGGWAAAWNRFQEAPQRYLGVVTLLRLAAPPPELVDDPAKAEVWPNINKREESNLRWELVAMAERSPEEMTQIIEDLEAGHGFRRRFIWTELGQSPLAVLLEPLSHFARLVKDRPRGADAHDLAEQYFTEGWKVDATFMETLERCRGPANFPVVRKLVQKLYLSWLDETSRSLQKLLLPIGGPPPSRNPVPEKAPGRLMFFVNGFRMDLAHRLMQHFEAKGLEPRLSWDWSTVPSITATAKPHCSPIAAALGKGDGYNQFAPSFPDGKRLTAERFAKALRGEGWQILKEEEIGDPEGSAWAEWGGLDRLGHATERDVPDSLGSGEESKMAHNIDGEIADLAARIEALLAAGWREVNVVTDHGWLFLPCGLPKKIFLTGPLAEHSWGRYAALNENAPPSGVDVYKWRWNEDVGIVVPPGASCFVAGAVYSYGGISLQETVIPRLALGLAGGECS